MQPQTVNKQDYRMRKILSNTTLHFADALVETTPRSFSIAIRLHVFVDTDAFFHILVLSTVAGLTCPNSPKRMLLKIPSRRLSSILPRPGRVERSLWSPNPQSPRLSMFIAGLEVLYAAELYQENNQQWPNNAWDMLNIWLLGFI